MKFSLLATILMATLAWPRQGVCAGSNSPPSVTSATNYPPAELAEPKSYLFPYHDGNWSTKYLEWLWKDPLNLMTRPVYWRSEEWETFGVEAGVTGALMPLDRT